MFTAMPVAKLLSAMSATGAERRGVDESSGQPLHDDSEIPAVLQGTREFGELPDSRFSEGRY